MYLLPTIRSCIGAVLVLAALALGRDPLSMRMVAVAAFVVLVFWPEALVGPSFQMSFAAVISIVALSGSVTPFNHDVDGTPYALDPATGRIDLAPRSSLQPLPWERGAAGPPS